MAVKTGVVHINVCRPGTIDMLIYTCYRMHNKLFLLNIHSQRCRKVAAVCNRLKTRAENAIATQLYGARKRVRQLVCCGSFFFHFFFIFYDCIYAKCQRANIITHILLIFALAIILLMTGAWSLREADNGDGR